MLSSESFDDLSGGNLYVDDQFLGAGGEGSVYLCKSIQNDGQMVIKKKRTCGDLHSANIALKEAMAMARVSSSGRQVCLIDVFLEPHPSDPSCFVLNLIMEYCAGGDLLTLIERDGSSISREQCMSVAVDLLESLKEIHDAGLMHRDVKSENVFLSDEGQPKLGDFGLASLSKSRNDAAGTALYSAPEIFAPGGKYSQSADVWSLGCVLYELALGETLFSKKLMLAESDIDSLIAKLRKGDPAWTNYRKLLAQCLQRDPFHRPIASSLLNHLKRPAAAMYNNLRMSTLAVPSVAKEKLGPKDLRDLQSYALKMLRNHPMWNISGAKDEDVASLLYPMMAHAIQEGQCLGVWKDGAFGRKLKGALVTLRPRDSRLFGECGPLRLIKNRLTLMYRNVFNASQRAFASKQLKFLNALKKHIGDPELQTHYILLCAASGGDHIKVNLVEDLQSWVNENALTVLVSEEDDFNLYQKLGFVQAGNFQSVRVMRWSPSRKPEKPEEPEEAEESQGTEDEPQNAAASAKGPTPSGAESNVKITRSSSLKTSASRDIKTSGSLRSAQSIAITPPKGKWQRPTDEPPVSPRGEAKLLSLERRSTTTDSGTTLQPKGEVKPPPPVITLDAKSDVKPAPRVIRRPTKKLPQPPTLRMTNQNWSFADEEDDPLKY